MRRRSAKRLTQPHLDPATVPLAHFQSPETRAVNEKQERDLKTRIAGLDEVDTVVTDDGLDAADRETLRQHISDLRLEPVR